MWHGYLEGYPEVDERGLTEDIARRKAQSAWERLKANGEEVPAGSVRVLPRRV